jgi:glyceraldehyde 3-phosphate dehydrogenase
MHKYKETLKVGINGFGRFGVHFLKYWLERHEKCNFNIIFINDEILKPNDIIKILKKDKFCKFYKVKFFLENNILSITLPKGMRYEIKLFNKKIYSLPLLKKLDYLLECSGKFTEKKSFKKLLVNKKIKILISATSWDCDQTIVYGFNHKSIKKTSRVISYGSCTVNAYVPLANYINKEFKIIDSDVNVIHNIQTYKLSDFNTLNRKFCTLEKSGPNLLNFVNKNNFTVNYTVIPYDGVSMIDFRFRVNKKINLQEFLKVFKKGIRNGMLKDLYSMIKFDTGPEVNKFTTSSSVFIENAVEIKNNSIYLHAYFDNENSVNRYYDLLNYISK